MIVSGVLEMIGPDGCLGARVALAAPSLQSCAEALPAVLAPPVSASIDKVYFRDGDRKIRFLTPNGRTGDVTTVPGSSTTISFFSISPDDQRIAVMVEDMTAADTISLRIYVEDLIGAGHHFDIYSSTIPKGKGGLTEWPMGWYQGRLVLAVVPACSITPVISPVEWHVVDATTGGRLATAPGVGINCWSTLWPSPAGTACYDGAGSAVVHDWSGRQVWKSGLPACCYVSLSPAGRSVAVAGARGMDGSQGFTVATNLGETSKMTFENHQACLWISDSALLAPDSVLEYPSGQVTALAPKGECAGRFPGGL